jgi:hypothetical protein
MSFMLSVTKKTFMLSVVASASDHCAEHHYAECSWFFSVMLTAVIMNAVVLTVMAPLVKRLEK